MSQEQFWLASGALIDEDVFLEICGVLEHGLPAGPSFVYSLGALAEALVIHDKIYFDPLGQAKDRDRRGEPIQDHLRQFSLVQELLREGVLTPFPSEEQVDSQLASRNSEYRLAAFRTQFTWLDQAGLLGMTPTFSAGEHEHDRLRFLRSAIKEAAFLFSAEELIESYTGWSPHQATLVIRNNRDNLPAFRAARQLGLDHNNLVVLSGLNRRARAYVELCGHLGIHPYLHHNALPHQLGAVGVLHSRIRKIYETVAERVTAVDEPSIGASEFARLPIPPLAQIAMARCKGAPHALAYEILALRQRHQKFRTYLSEFDRQWNQADSRADRHRLRREFDGAWRTLVAQQDRPVEGMISRIIGFVWHLAKGLSPKDAIVSAGDRIMASWRDHSVVRKVSGLHDFYQELTHSPVLDRNLQLVESLSLKVADQQVWKDARDFAQEANAAFVARDPSLLEISQHHVDDSAT